MKVNLSDCGCRPCRLDPRRKRTRAEMKLVMSVFRCSEDEAWGILSANSTAEKKAEVRGMLDAALVEQEIRNGRILRTPAWLIRP